MHNLFIVLLLLTASAPASQESAEDHFNRGLALFEQDELKKAEKEFKKARKADRSWAEPVFYLGLCAHSRDDFKKARRYYREALALSPGHEDAIHWLRVAEESEKLRKARDHLERGRHDKLAEALISYVRRGGQLRTALSVLLPEPTSYAFPFVIPLFEAFDERDRLDLAAGLVEFWAAEAPGDAFAVESLRGVLHLRNDDEQQARRVCDTLLAASEQPGFVLGSFKAELFDHFGVAHDDPQILERKIPSYTQAAIGYRIEGTVLLRGIVGLDGRFSQLQVLRGLGYGLDEEAIQVIRRGWLLKPARFNGKSVPKVATIEVTFNLRR